MMKMNALALAIFLCTIVSCHCTKINPKNNNATLIQQTCKQTPNYALCIKYLKSDPRTSDADLPGLALFMMDRVEAGVTTALNTIGQVINRRQLPYQMDALNSCAGGYRSILVDVIPSSIAALKQGDPKVAEDGANETANEATTCENSFKGKSPISDENIAMHDVAVITAAIVKQML